MDKYLLLSTIFGLFLGLLSYVLLYFLYKALVRIEELKNTISIYTEMEKTYSAAITELKNYNFELQTGLFRVLYQYDKNKLLNLVNEIMDGRSGPISDADKKYLTEIRTSILGPEKAPNKGKIGEHDNIIMVDFKDKE